MKVVGITGLAGSGKTTVAEYLVHHGYTRIRFADTLKAMLATFGLNSDQLNGDLKETTCDMLCGKTPRWAMQALGTEFGRNLIGDDVWVNAWLHQVRGCGSQKIVADDVRFHNEVAAIYRLGGVVAHIERPNSPIDIGREHASEAHDLDYDVHIINNGTLQDLFRKIDFRLIRGEAVPERIEGPWFSAPFGEVA